MAKNNKIKRRETAEQILQRLSERMFPAEMGKASVTVHSREADGDGVLHNLLYGRDFYSVKTLIEAGADVNLVGNLGYAPLHVAAWRDHTEAIEMLLEAGADPGVRCEVGKTALDTALENGYRDIARLLKKR